MYSYSLLIVEYGKLYINKAIDILFGDQNIIISKTYFRIYLNNG